MPSIAQTTAAPPTPTDQRNPIEAFQAPAAEYLQAAEQAISVMEQFRTNMRATGKSTPGVEAFVDEINALITAGVSPTDALETLFRTLASKRAEQTEVRA